MVMFSEQPIERIMCAVLFSVCSLLSLVLEKFAALSSSVVLAWCMQVSMRGSVVPPEKLTVRLVVGVVLLSLIVPEVLQAFKSLKFLILLRCVWMSKFTCFLLTSMMSANEISLFYGCAEVTVTGAGYGL